MCPVEFSGFVVGLSQWLVEDRLYLSRQVGQMTLGLRFELALADGAIERTVQ